MSNNRQTIEAILTDRAHKGLAQAISRELVIPSFGYESNTFASTKELAVHTGYSFKGKAVAVIASLRPNLHTSIFEHFLVLGALKNGGAAKVISVLPFLPYSRSDKQFHEHGPVGASVMLDLLQAAGTDRIVTVELHGATATTQPLISDVDATPVIVRQVKKWQRPDTILVAEDEGALPKVVAISLATNLPYLSFSKQRTGDDTVQLAAKVVAPRPGFHAIIIDDAMYTAATISEACQRLRDMGAATIDIIITHALLTQSGRNRLEAAGISKIAVSDSLPSRVRNVPYAQVFTIAEPLARMLKRLS